MPYRAVVNIIEMPCTKKKKFTRFTTRGKCQLDREHGNSQAKTKVETFYHFVSQWNNYSSSFVCPSLLFCYQAKSINKGRELPKP